MSLGRFFLKIATAVTKIASTRKHESTPTRPNPDARCSSICYGFYETAGSNDVVNVFYYVKG